MLTHSPPPPAKKKKKILSAKQAELYLINESDKHQNQSDRCAACSLYIDTGPTTASTEENTRNICFNGKKPLNNSIHICHETSC